jgi:hypothetical protein
LFFPQSSARLAHINIGGTAHGSAESQATNSNTDNVPRGDFGLIGLAVMGQNLILNAADHGFEVVAFNRTVSKVDHFLANEAKGKFYRPTSYDFQSMLTDIINRKINRRRTLD